MSQISIVNEGGTKQGDIDLVFRQIHEKIISALAIMDDKSRTNMEYNSEMLWFSEWHELRQLIYEVLDLSSDGRSANSHR